MTDVKAAEPSIEEILASIRKIISDDDEPSPEISAAAPAPVIEEPEEDEVLELTDIVLEMPVEVAAPEPDASFAEPEPEPVVIVESPLSAQVIAPEPPKTNEPKTDEGTMSAEEPADERQSIVSESTFTAAAGALSRLTHSESQSSGGKSVEDITRDLLRPMLKAWLDQNLPVLVEKLVERELKKISRKAEDV